MVKAVILVKSSKKLIAAKIGKIDQIFESFPDKWAMAKTYKKCCKVRI